MKVVIDNNMTDPAGGAAWQVCCLWFEIGFLCNCEGDESSGNLDKMLDNCTLIFEGQINIPAREPQGKLKYR